MILIAGKGGDVLSFISLEKQLPFKEAVAEGQKYAEEALLIDPVCDQKALSLLQLYPSSKILEKTHAFKSPVERVETGKATTETIKPSLTQEKVMAEIQEKHRYLEANWWKNLTNEGFGVKDFQGTLHTRPWEYLVAVAKDSSINRLIDYDHPVIDSMRAALEKTLKGYIPQWCVVDIEEREQGLIKKLELTKEDFVAEIEKNISILKTSAALEQRYQEGVGVRDFNGKRHLRVDSYLAGIGLDPSVQHLIDPKSPLGQSIQKEAERLRHPTLNQEKGLSL